MGCTGAGRKGWYVEGASVCRVHLLVVGQTSDDRHWKDVQCQCVGHEKMASGTRIENGPLFDGFGIGVNCFGSAATARA
jgi:hypothetical protein